MYNKNYLSKRPFLIVNTKFKPGPNARTQQKNWAETAGWNVIEEVSIVDRVTPKHTTYATLIVDILEAKCIKNGFGNASNDDAMGHFMQKYKDQVKEAMSIWLEREAQRVARENVLELDAAREQVRVTLNDTVGKVDVELTTELAEAVDSVEETTTSK